MFYTLTFNCEGNNLSAEFSLPNNMKKADYYKLKVQNALVDSIGTQGYEIMMLECSLLQPLSYNSTTKSSSKVLAYLTNDYTVNDIDGTPTVSGLQFHRNILPYKTIISASPGDTFSVAIKLPNGASYPKTADFIRWSFTILLEPIES